LHSIMFGSHLVTIAVQMCLIFGCELWPKAPGKFRNWTGKLLENSWKTPGIFFFQKCGNPVPGQMQLQDNYCNQFSCSLCTNSTNVSTCTHSPRHLDSGFVRWCRASGITSWTFWSVHISLSCCKQCCHQNWFVPIFCIFHFMVPSASPLYSFCSSVASQ